MNTMQICAPRRQRGVATLLIALVLLAILTVITVFAANYGLFEQRTSGNEYRYKLAFQTAEAGLGQGVEYLKANTAVLVSDVSGGWLFPGSEKWTPCDTTAPPAGELDPCAAEVDPDRRAGMYRYVGSKTSTTWAMPLATVLPTAAAISHTGGTSNFATSYKTYATLCRLDLSNPAAPRCSLAPSSEGTFYVTVVSRAVLADENSQATVKQSFGTFRLLGSVPAAPLIAAGTAVGLGNAQLVPNPDAAGFTVPVSIWSQGDANIDQASFASCNLGEWLANYGTPAPSAEDKLNGVCESCTCNGLCPGYGLLSGNAKSCPVAKDKLEGEDILDVDSNYSDASPKVRDSKYFPDDLFAYVFGIASSSADSYLDTNATKVADCSTLTSGSSGLMWHNATTECALVGTKPTPGTPARIGSLQNPVVLVSDGPVTMAANSQFFGIVFVRSKAGTGDLFTANGGGQVYGSVILEGNASLHGNPTLVYNKTVLRNIFNSPSFVRYGPIPGSWSDDVLN